MKRINNIYVYEPGIKKEDIAKAYGCPSYEKIEDEDASDKANRFVGVRKTLHQQTNNPEKRIPYFVCVRKNNVQMEGVPDAVSTLAYFVKDGEVYFVLNSQFRPPIEQRETSTFEGLVEKKDLSADEDKKKECVKNAAQREAEEELGAKIIKTMPISGVMSKSAGFSNEKEQMFLSEVDVTTLNPQLEPDEDIVPFIVRATDIESFVEDFADSMSPILFGSLAACLAFEKCKTFIKTSVQQNQSSTSSNDEDESQ